MRAPVTIYERNGWKLTSQGNGAFYVLSCDGKSILFQGDDASWFRAETMDSDGFLTDRCESVFADYLDIMQVDSEG